MVKKRSSSRETPFTVRKEDGKGDKLFHLLLYFGVFCVMELGRIESLNLLWMKLTVRSTKRPSRVAGRDLNRGPLSLVS
jgi:hypothetical protein